MPAGNKSMEQNKIVSPRQLATEEIIRKLMNRESWLSYSSISAFKESPKDFIDYKTGERKETDAMIYGSMVHCLVLEPDDFENRYHPLDDSSICLEIGGAKPRATNKYKEWLTAQKKLAGDKSIVSPDDYRHARIIAANVRFNRASRKVLDMAEEKEKPIEWDFKNFQFKGYIDGYGKRAIFDLKTCPDASPSKFHRDIISNGYYLQAAMYRMGMQTSNPYFIIAVDKNGGISVHQLDDDLIEYGLIEYTKLCDRFNECILSDSWSQSYDFWAERFDGIYRADKPARFY